MGGFRRRSGGGSMGGFLRLSGGRFTGGFLRLGGSLLSTGRATYCINPVCYFPCASSIACKKISPEPAEPRPNRSDSRKGAKRAKWDTVKSNDQNTKIQNVIIRTRVFGFLQIYSTLFGFRYFGIEQQLSRVQGRTHSSA